jgi:hypothetical protein
MTAESEDAIVAVGLLIFTTTNGLKYSQTELMIAKRVKRRE